MVQQRGPTDGQPAATGLPAATGPHDVATARALVGAQFALLALIALLPARSDWPVPAGLMAMSVAGAVLGLTVMVLGATALGRGLTALPLPNAQAQLRTGGLYRWVRHPIYSGLLLTAASIAASSGSVPRAVAFALLVTLLTIKARWEEARLQRRFEGYAEYARRTPRFLPRRRRSPLPPR